MVQANSHFRTSDTALAAFLVAAHHFLVSIDYSQPRAEFLFDSSEEIREMANNYLVGNALTDPSHYSRIYRKLNRILRKQCQWADD